MFKARCRIDSLISLIYFLTLFLFSFSSAAFFLTAYTTSSTFCSAHVSCLSLRLCFKRARFMFACSLYAKNDLSIPEENCWTSYKFVIGFCSLTMSFIPNCLHKSLRPISLPFDAFMVLHASICSVNCSF